MIHLIYVPFTGLGLFDGFRGEKWFAERAEIFRNYTLKSLRNQSNKNFILWLSFRPEEEDNPTTYKIESYLKKSGLDYVLTFDGIMMYDDRGVEHNKDLKERIGRSMERIRPIVEGSRWVFVTDCGSDDMFSRDAVKEIQMERPRPKGATYYLNGYVYNIPTDRLAYWKRTSSHPQYTIIYPTETFLDADKHFKYIEGLESHEYVPLIFDATRLSDNMYCCTTHGYNISTIFDHPLRGDEIIGKEKDKIMKQFGL